MRRVLSLTRAAYTPTTSNLRLGLVTFVTFVTFHNVDPLGLPTSALAMRSFFGLMPELLPTAQLADWPTGRLAD